MLLALGVVSAVLELVERLRAPVPGAAAGPEASARPAAVGLVVPGVVDAAGGRAVFSANLGFRDVALREIVERASGLPALLEHDVRAAGVAEQALGATAGVQDYLLAVIGTGIAAVVCTGGQRVTGAGGVSGELGHIPVWPGGERCGCGQRGCLERYASAAAIARRYAQAGGEPGLSAGDVLSRVAGDERAQRVWAQAVRALGLALSTVTMLLDPELIVLAGGLSQAGAALLEPVRRELRELVVWRDPPRVELSPLGVRAGLLGAALLARQLV
jgi:glucokinase